MTYKITSNIDYAVTLLYLEDDGSISNIAFYPSDILYITDDSFRRYMNLGYLLDPALNIFQIRKEG